MKTQLQTLSSALLLTLGLGSCQALQSQFMPGESVTRVDDGLLSEVSAEEMNEIQTVRAARDAAKDDLALAERETRRAENREDLAKSEKKIAKLQLEDAKLRVKFSEAEGTLSELRTDRKQLEWADANMGTAELRFKLRGFQVDRAEAAESLAEELFALRVADVELAKARALRKLNRVSVQVIEIEMFQLQVEECSTRCDVAREKLASTTETVDTMRSEYTQSRTMADDLRIASN
jgi:hypothetical protein